MIRSVFSGLFILACTTNAFTPTFRQNVGVRRSSRSQVRMDVATVLNKVQDARLLSKVSELGLLSKAEAAGITLTDLVPLLRLADEFGAVSILASVIDEPYVPQLIDLAPKLLPLAGTALNIDPSLLYIAAIGSLGAAAAEVVVIPDDSLQLVALQTFLAILLGAVVPAASLVGAFVLGYKK
eukprot:CAMPEP_0185743122 /NCGR_PEP_ID=MMETSP1174-20130828/724_1 /TAXON_ID=35687 /ORGANISM="Dictyocha speculum, Strain CCMP1381" /LENGTH=181 /DNA_ID=CAMNT_0028415563 /DNA_START=66 /DNA_END=611 /DNA_ORIENTATION=+